MSETWLNDSFYDSEICDDRYVTFRNDKNYIQCDVNRGGGVMCCVKRKYRPELIAKSDSVDFQWVCLSLSIDGTKILICCVYISCNSSLNVYENFTDSLCTNNMLTAENLIVIGDFNIPNITGKDCSLFVGSSKAQLINDMISEYDMYSINNVKNHSGNTLDLVLTNITEADVEDCSDDALVSVDNYHPVLRITFKIHSNHKKILGKILGNNIVNASTYDFAHGNYPLLYQLLNEQDWTGLTAGGDVDHSLELYYKILYNIFDSCIPKRKIASFNKNFPKWFTKELIHKLHQKKHYFKMSKKQSRFRIKYREIYCKLRTETKKLVKQCHTEFLNNVEHNINEDTNQFWKFIKEKRKNTSISYTYTYQDTDYNTEDSIANAFAKFFQDMYSDGDSPPNNDDLLDYGLDILSLDRVTADDVSEAVKTLKPRASVGVDGIPSYFYKAYLDILQVPLQALINKSLESSRFPNQLKIGRITPIHKGGNTRLVESYRPVTVLPALSKIFERIIHTKITQHVQRVIIDQQHGFCKNRSTVTNLSVFSKYVSFNLEFGSQIDVIYTDLAKAFDKVNHAVLIRKFESFSFSTKLISYLRSYLSNRYQYVKFDNASSNKFIAASGVPQGSILGPLLFTLFINDISECIKHSQYLLYADDLKIYNCILTESNCQNLQKDLDAIVSYCTKNDLKLNINKCKHLSIHRKRSPIVTQYTIDSVALNSVQEMSDLGILFCSSFSFGGYCETLCADGMRRLGFVLRSCAHFKNAKTYILLFNAFVRSKLEYASVIWNPTTNLHKDMLEKVQKRFLRFLFFKKHGFYPGYPHLISYRYQLTEFHVMELEKRREFNDVIFIFNIVNQRVGHNAIATELLSDIYFDVPDIRLRRRDFMFKTTSSQSYLNRCLKSVNQFVAGNPTFDVINDTKSQLLKCFYSRYMYG